MILFPAASLSLDHCPSPLLPLQSNCSADIHVDCVSLFFNLSNDSYVHCNISRLTGTEAQVALVHDPKQAASPSCLSGIPTSASRLRSEGLEDLAGAAACPHDCGDIVEAYIHIWKVR